MIITKSKLPKWIEEFSLEFLPIKGIFYFVYYKKNRVIFVTSIRYPYSDYPFFEIKGIEFSEMLGVNLEENANSKKILQDNFLLNENLIKNKKLESNIKTYNISSNCEWIFLAN